jgi:hypothetical protein
MRAVRARAHLERRTQPRHGVMGPGSEPQIVARRTNTGESARWSRGCSARATTGEAMTLIISSSDASRSVTQANTVIVGMPLDAITRVDNRPSIATVVLAGAFANNDELAMFLAEFYPTVRLERED